MSSTKHESLGRWISLLYRLREVYFERELGPHGIGPAQLRILLALDKALRHDRDTTQAGIARDLRLDKGAMARSIRKLEQAGLVRRERAPGDRREYRLTLTAQAHARTGGLRAIRRRWSGILGQGFTPDEERAALAHLGRMAENADAFLHATTERTRP